MFTGELLQQIIGIGASLIARTLTDRIVDGLNLVAKRLVIYLFLLFFRLWRRLLYFSFTRLAFRLLFFCRFSVNDALTLNRDFFCFFFGALGYRFFGIHYRLYFHGRGNLNNLLCAIRRN